MNIVKDQIKIFDEKIRNAEKIVLFAHKNPDGDALCSVLALGRLIELNYGKDVVCMYDGNIPDNLDEVPLRRRMHFFEKVDENMPVDVAIAMDYGVERNIGGPKKFMDRANFIIEIDHHLNDAKVGVLCLDDDTAAATAEIVYEMMRMADWKYDFSVLQLLMTAILTDTGFFKYVKNGNVMRIAGEIVDEGVIIQRIMNDLANKPRKTIITEAGAVANAEFLFRHRLALAIINNRQYRNLDGRGETVLSLLAQIHGVDYIVLLKEQKANQIGVSLRGRFKAVDKIAVELGGGGHEFAAGAVVYDTLDNVKARVIELFRKVVK
ncbi:MAG: DHH family phosphoesterase [Alphaproteobacteria bacterium]|nr:DHH family phosphoesterase [Alphaproteobacteria bacterium]